jgi:metal-responsive CopG/Arc/MetJ family transcriptional regulator
MKTAIYIDQKLYDEAENFLHVAEMSRSKLYCTAINEYLQNHTQHNITKRLNDYYETHESGLDADVKEANYRLFSKEDW